MTDKPDIVPWLSIIIPTFNRDLYLRRAVESVRRQNDGHIEIIVSDDGSSDDTEAVIEELNRTAPKVGFLRSARNTGASAARNRGANAARGRWFFFLDSDDELLPGGLDRIRERIQAGTVDVVYFHAQVQGPAGKTAFYKKQVLPESLDRGELLTTEKRPFTQSQLSVRAMTFQAIGGFDERLLRGHDIDLWVRLLLFDATIGVVNAVLVNKHEGHAGALTADSSGAYRDKRMFLLKHKRALKKLLSREQYERWWIAQMETFHWVNCRTVRGGKTLNAFEAVGYCARWAALALVLRSSRRRHAMRRFADSIVFFASRIRN